MSEINPFSSGFQKEQINSNVLCDTMKPTDKWHCCFLTHARLPRETEMSVILKIKGRRGVPKKTWHSRDTCALCAWCLCSNCTASLNC